MSSRYMLMLMIIMAFISPVTAIAFVDTAKITIEVVDEKGNKIENANVGIGFDDYRTPSNENSVKGLTDSKGYFTGSAPCTSGYLGFNVKKSGYYLSKGHYQFNGKGSLGWQPWNPTIEVLLRKIENPVPMYARNTKYSTIEIPVVGEDVGFDLIKFDWVIPYGKATHADFIFHLKRRVVDRKDFDATLTVTFSDNNDGIQSYSDEMEDGSQFKLPRYAPENGYQKRLVLKEWRHPGDYNVKRNFDFLASDMNYIFRVRSEEQNGQLIRAMYGKIQGFIDFTAVHSKTAKIYFKYYLNPDYTRNLEYDPDRNLFGSLPPLERVGIK